MRGGELEVRWSGTACNVRAFFMRRRVIEGPGEGTSLGIPKRWIVEPYNLKQRRVHCRNGPFATARIGERDASHLTAGVVARHDIDVLATPAVISFVVARR